MYERFFGLKEKPFSLTPDPDFLFINKRFREALDNVIYGIKRQEGFTAIVGDVGTGKTTLCWALLGKLNGNIRTALILNPLLNEEDMLKAILQDFGVRPRNGWSPPPAEAEPPYDPGWMKGLSRKELIDELNCFLLSGSESGVFNILIVDEAQNLSLPVLEQLRILSNLETAKKKLLQIIFVGQLEFRQKLSLPQLRQLDQRITIRYSLVPLSKQDMVQYIEHRLSVAGSKGNVSFTPGALRRIYRYSKGYPRLINIICDRSLLAGYGARARVITSRMVAKASRGIRGEEKGARTPFLRFRKWVISLAALAALALLAALCFWIWRGALTSRSDSLTPPSSVLAAARGKSDPQPGEASLKSASEQVIRAIVPEADGPAGTGNRLPAPSAAGQVSDSSMPAAVSNEDRAAGASTFEFAGKFLLQVHSLRTRDQADTALADLQQKGYSAFVRTEATLNGAPWFVIYAGPYDTLAGAHAGADALRQKEGITPIIRGY